jgi:ubiquinone/menaquinone biosynthesis C-methylase UbiE
MAILNFICPYCLSQLSKFDNHWYCSTCNKHFPIKGNIHLFNETNGYFYTPIEKDNLQKLRIQYQSGMIDYKNYITSLVNCFPSESAKENVSNLLGDSRTSWIFLLKGNSSGNIVLNFGCGWDNTTLNMARRYEHVVAVDLTVERLEVLKIKAQNANIDNITYVCGGDTPSLPFASDTFHIITMNGVLEWVAAKEYYASVSRLAKNALYHKLRNVVKYIKNNVGDTNPFHIQVRFLKEINRVLKDGGELYIGIENRYSHKYFKGIPDDHSHLFFSSLMPRPMANLYTIVTQRRPYRTYTYSCKGYSKLLEHASFSNPRFYSLVPSYKDINQIIDLQDKHAIGAYANTKQGLIKKTVVKHFLSLFCDSFGIVSYKNHVTNPWLNDFVEQLHKTYGGNRSVSIDRLFVSKKDVINIFIKGGFENKKQAGDYPSVVIKLPINKNSFMNLEKNYTSLSLIQNIPKTIIQKKGIAPKPLFKGVFEKQAYFSEQFIEGIPLPEIWPSLSSLKRSMIIEDIQKIICNLGEVTREEKTISMPTLENLLENKIRRILNRVTDVSARKSLTYIGKSLRNTLEKRSSITLVFLKGDFSSKNVLIDRETGAVNGIIDWDMSMENGFELVDLINMYESCQRGLYGVSFHDTMSKIAKDLGNICPDEFSMLAELCRNSPFYGYLGVIGYWLDHVSAHIDYSYIFYDKEWMEENFFSLIPVFEKLVMDL